MLQHHAGALVQPSPTHPPHLLATFDNLLRDSKQEVERLCRSAIHTGNALTPPFEGDLLRGAVRYSVRADTRPPAFGQFDHCHPARRCVGCQALCPAERRLASLSSPMRRPAGPANLAAAPLAVVEFVLEAGQPIGQGWCGADVLVPGRPHIGGAFSVVMSPEQVLQLISCDGRVMLTPANDGLIVHTSAAPHAGTWQGRVTLGWELQRRARTLDMNKAWQEPAAGQTARHPAGLPTTSLGGIA